MPSNVLQDILSERQGYRGLTSSEAKKRLEQYGYNVRLVTTVKTWFKRLAEIFAEPMLLFLLATAVVYFFIGDKLEASILLLSIIPIGGMEFFQRKRTDEAIVALDKTIVQYAEAERDGQLIKLDVKYLVPGDLVYVTAGDQIAADGYLLTSAGLLADEAVLTGESVAVVKSEIAGGILKITEENKLWQGTFVVQGEGYMLVMETGSRTVYGKLGGLLEKIAAQKTPLQYKIEKLVRGVALFALFFAILIGFILTLKLGFLEGLFGALTIAIAIIPEEFPIVFSVFLIMGVQRMSKQKALIREMAMVETLGSATVICTDKTGTLTEGKMSLNKIYHYNQIFDLKVIKEHTVDFSNLVKDALLSLEQVAIDPIEVEVQRFAKEIGIKVKEFYKEYILVRDSSFDSRTKTVSHIWKNKTSGLTSQYTVGAPEFVIKNCFLSDSERSGAERACEKMSEEGFRVVAVATKQCKDGDCITADNLKLVGLLAMSDPPRVGVKEAMAMCQKAGIRIIMVTGDNKLTAHNIAESIGLIHNEEIISGEELEKLSPAALAEAVKRHSIFARVKPEHKYLIVEALQNSGEVVAMTGDGVNDAPALKKADIGIAMGGKGTEVARAAAGIVLLDDNFTTIVNAVREGRRIYDNLRQAFVFLFSFHIPIVGMALIPIFWGYDLFFIPIQIIFLEFICDPAAVLGFERNIHRRGLMNESPRPTKEPLINPRLWWQVLVRGVSIFVLSFGLYFYFGLYSGNPALGRTIAFSAMVVAQIMLVIFSCEWHQVKGNKLLLSIAGLTIIALILIIFIPPLSKLFHFVPIGPSLFSFSVFLAVLVMGTVSLALRRKRAA